jgi:hypothetical protein
MAADISSAAAEECTLLPNLRNGTLLQRLFQVVADVNQWQC